MGQAIAKAMIEAGAKVRIVGRREDLLKRTCENLGPGSSYTVFDLNELNRIPSLVSEIHAELGGIDVLINNAGIHLKKDCLDVSDQEFEDVIRINQQAVFSLTREFAKEMVPSKKGSIIMISSMAARYGIPKVIAYTAAKSAVEGMTRALAVELSPSGLRVNCIAPGFIETEMSSRALDKDPERRQRVMSRTPMGRLGQAEDVAYAAVFLSSDAARYITGTILPVDGGNSIGF